MSSMKGHFRRKDFPGKSNLVQTCLFTLFPGDGSEEREVNLELVYLFRVFPRNNIFAF